MFNPSREMYVMESKRQSLDEQVAHHRLVKEALKGQVGLVQRLFSMITNMFSAAADAGRTRTSVRYEEPKPRIREAHR